MFGILMSKAFIFIFFCLIHGLLIYDRCMFVWLMWVQLGREGVVVPKRSGGFHIIVDTPEQNLLLEPNRLAPFFANQ